MQRALLQYYNPKNRELITKALKKAGRYDLIGKGDKCLVDFPKGANPANKHKNMNGGKHYGKKRQK